MGQYNAGGYANPEVDALIEKAAKTVDLKAREKLVQEASAKAMDDVALIPLHTQYSISAGRAGLDYTPARRRRHPGHQRQIRTITPCSDRPGVKVSSLPDG